MLCSQPERAAPPSTYADPRLQFGNKLGFLLLAEEPRLVHEPFWWLGPAHQPGKSPS